MKSGSFMKNTVRWVSTIGVGEMGERPHRTDLEEPIGPRGITKYVSRVWKRVSKLKKESYCTPQLIGSGHVPTGKADQRVAREMPEKGGHFGPNQAVVYQPRRGGPECL